MKLNEGEDEHDIIIIVLQVDEVDDETLLLIVDETELLYNEMLEALVIHQWQVVDEEVHDEPDVQPRHVNDEPDDADI